MRHAVCKAGRMKSQMFRLAGEDETMRILAFDQEIYDA